MSACVSVPVLETLGNNETESSTGYNSPPSLLYEIST